ncbi:MAG: calcium-binding protein, partial [Paracoccaceae bacterium]|nr:calcium-binding protein [Paracoccaceae bacterium]
AGLRHVATGSGGAGQFFAGITDLTVAMSAGGGMRLYAGTRLGGGLSVFDIDTPTAAVTLAQQAYVSGLGYLTTPRIEVLTGAGASFILPVGLLQGAAGGYTLTSSGVFGARMVFDAGLTPPSDLIAMTSLISTSLAGDGQTLVLASRQGQASPLVYVLETGGQLRPFGSGLPQAPGASLTALSTLTVGGQDILLALSPEANQIISYRVGGDGQITQAATLDSLSSGLGFNLPVALDTVTLPGAGFAVMAGAGSSSLTVLRLTADGTMVAVDQVIDSLDTRFQTVSALETLVVGDRVFVLAGGADDGISLFTLLPDGRLIHLQTLADTAALTLNNVSAIAAAWAGGRAQVFVTSDAEAGITQFTLDTGPLGLTRAGGGALIEGGALNDLLMAGALTADLRGAAGDDILVASGSAGQTVQIRGGQGRDHFVLAHNGRTTWIMDYEPGIDRLDLTLFPMLRSLQQLQILSTAQGATLRFGDTVIEIVTITGTPLAAGHFTDAALLGLTRLAIEIAPEIMTGTEAAEELSLGRFGGSLFGLAGDDTLYGGAGDDFIDGGAGNDLIFGIAGVNQLFGGTGSDTITGGNGGDLIAGGPDNDRLLGGTGNDAIYGGGGNDFIDGGAGNDLIFGIAGVNQLFGGT